jgi:hypothetical protein
MHTHQRFSFSSSPACSSYEPRSHTLPAATPRPVDREVTPTVLRTHQITSGATHRDQILYNAEVSLSAEEMKRGRAHGIRCAHLRTRGDQQLHTADDGRTNTTSSSRQVWAQKKTPNSRVDGMGFTLLSYGRPSRLSIVSLLTSQGAPHVLPSAAAACHGRHAPSQPHLCPAATPQPLHDQHYLLRGYVHNLDPNSAATCGYCYTDSPE